LGLGPGAFEQGCPVEAIRNLDSADLDRVLESGHQASFVLEAAKALAGCAVAADRTGRYAGVPDAGESVERPQPESPVTARFCPTTALVRP
jgi:hypothetical protein